MAGRRPATDLLGAALRLAGAALSPPARSFAAASDPLRLELPPLALPGAPRVGAHTVSSYAALYLHAELEQAGVLPVVEALAEMRHTLALRDARVLQRLERFAQGATGHPSRAQRAELYARLFGIGEGARPDPRHPSRIDFMQRLLRLASAIDRFDGERQRNGQASSTAQILLRAGAQQLIELLAAQPEGYLVHSARRIHARALAAFEVLGDEGLRTPLGTRTPWETLRRLAQDAIAGMDDAARRGASGQTVLRWLASALPWLADLRREVAAPDAATAIAARRWMIAAGLPATAHSLARHAAHTEAAA